MPPIADRVRAILATALGRDPAAVADGAFLVDLGADSLDRIEMALTLEEHLGVDVCDNDAAVFGTTSTVGDVVALVERLIA